MLIIVFFCISVLAFFVSQVSFFKKKNSVKEHKLLYYRSFAPIALFLLQFIITKIVHTGFRIDVIIFIILCAIAGYNIKILADVKKNAGDNLKGFLKAAIISSASYILLNISIVVYLHYFGTGPR